MPCSRTNSGRLSIVVATLSLLAGCVATPESPAVEDAVEIIVLGIAQDAGFPQAGCRKDCCARAWSDPTAGRHVACLGIVDGRTGARWLVDATPDLREQLRTLDEIAPPPSSTSPSPLSGVFLTHAHIGHYTGLMFVGHESMGASELPVYAMPRMREFLSSNGPWDQLVRYGNIVIEPIEADRPVALDDRITVTPIRVPHREEYTEVVGFVIRGPRRSALYIPDIDKWERWERRLEDVLAEVDIALLDGTFYADGELAGRDMSIIPHPFIAETMERLAPLPAAERAKVRFIHLNHTNPALDAESDATRAIRAAGFGIALQGERIGL